MNFLKDLLYAWNISYIERGYVIFIMIVHNIDTSGTHYLCWASLKTFLFLSFRMELKVGSNKKTGF